MVQDRRSSCVIAYGQYSGTLQWNQLLQLFQQERPFPTVMQRQWKEPYGTLKKTRGITSRVIIRNMVCAHQTMRPCRMVMGFVFV